MSYWISPCNVKLFDIVEHFKLNKQLVCKRLVSANVGDTVFLYLALPYSCMKYKCTVVERSVSNDVLANHSYATKGSFGKTYSYMMLELNEEYEDGRFPLNKLKENGLTQIQKQGRADRKLVEYLLNND